MTELKKRAHTRPSQDREGVASPYRICFACTGNTCRSPMAEAIVNAWAEAMLDRYPTPMREAMVLPFVAESAGLYANEGDPISESAVVALEEAGVKPVEGHDYHGHRATPVTEETVKRCDLLVGMTDRHAMELMLRYPEAAARITCMPTGIPDPFGGDLSVYLSCLACIEEGLRTLLAREGLRHE